MDVIIFGPPGAGKGTQSTAISEFLCIPQVATGDIFRRHLKEGTDLGSLAREYMNQGQLVPDTVVCDIVASRLQEQDCQTGALLDGFPRTVPQAKLLVEWLVDNHRKVDAVINLAVDDDILVSRLSGRRTCLGCGATYHRDHNPPANGDTCDRCSAEVVQREDDQEDTVRARLATYHRDTRPVLGWLEGSVEISTIDGSRSIDQVAQDIRTVLAPGQGDA